ncbi:MAG: histidine kinase dimerization/phospho-acceptor domain-containing protein, partial [Myxococcota bacterium]
MFPWLRLHVALPSVPGSDSLTATEVRSLLEEAISPAAARVLPAALVHVLVMPVLGLATPLAQDHPEAFWLVAGIYVLLAGLRVGLLQAVRRRQLPPTPQRFLLFSVPMFVSGLVWSSFTAAVTAWYGDHWLTLVMYLSVLFFAQATVLFYNPLRATTAGYFMALVLPATLGALVVDLSARPIVISISLLLVLQNLPSIHRLHAAHWAFAINRTLLERARAHSERASAAKSDFLAAVSHEIRTPLSGIIGVVSLLDADAATAMSEETRSHVQTIGVSAHSLLSLVDDLLDTARIEAGVVRLAPRAFSPHTLAKEVTTLFQGRAQQLQLRLSLEIDSGAPPRVIQDEDRCRQIMQNLVTNALKFTER